MKEITRETLDRLSQATWFVNVGKPIEGPFVVLKSWDEAVESCSSIEWENLLMEASNQLRERLLERNIERYRQWNEVVDELKQYTVPFVRRKLREVHEVAHLPKDFEDTVQWDILGVCIEAEYADVFSPAFYASQAYWYIEGRFPCGWQGKFPEGKLILY
jgi:hypothetical protein